MNVYIIKMEGSDLYKVGIAKDIKKRLSVLQTSNPEKLKLIISYKCDNAHDIEQLLHICFSEYRLQGEWFSLDGVQLEKLKLKINEFIKAGTELNPGAELDNIKKYFSEYNRRNLISVNALEKEAKIPPTSFRQFLDGGRKFPIKHITKIVDVIEKLGYKK